MSDLISRCELFNRLAPVQTLGEAYSIIQGMPTVEPELATNLQPSCNQLATDCISRQAAIDALSCENPTETYIDYYDAVKAIRTETYIDYDDAVKAIRQLPPAEPEIIRCEDCIKQDLCSWYRAGAKYCSYAERRTDE